jgi:hypothetical protein
MGAWLSSEQAQSSDRDKVPLESTTPVESLPPSPRTAALERLEQLETEIKNANRATREGMPIPSSGSNSREAQGRQGALSLFDSAQLGFA